MRTKAKAYDVDLLLVDTGVCGIEYAARTKLTAINRTYTMALA
jgi:hypothetical protein